jgi:predicted RNA-binding Zn-ribbon protein involved in translation (DUF1610 family)
LAGKRPRVQIPESPNQPRIQIFTNTFLRGISVNLSLSKKVTTKMPYKSIRHYNENLAENPNLSDHNKEVLDKFFQKMEGKEPGQSTLSDYASRFNALAPNIDFPLDNPTQDDIEILAGDINNDRVERLRGSGTYSDHSKEKFFKTIKCFYNQFIKKPGEGYKDEVDGDRLVDDISADANTEKEINLEEIPTPEQVRKVAGAANTLRDQCLILFCWSLGCRPCEVFKTPDIQKYPEPLKWKDIQFKDREMKVTIHGKTEGRTIRPRSAMPLMKQLYNQEDPESLEEPVFKHQQPRNFCPKCKDEQISPKQGQKNHNYEKRTYNCEQCGWEGTHHEAIKRRKPMKDSDARQVLRRCVGRAYVDKHITTQLKEFFRKGRACYWSARGRSEDFLRGWFGWAEDSDAPSFYKKKMEETVLKGVREDFGESLNEEEREFSQDFVQPFECENCGEWVSPMWNYCNDGCQMEIDDQLRAHNKPDTVLTETVDRFAKHSGASKLDGYDPRKDAKTVAEFNEARHKAKNRVIKRVAKESDIPETRIEDQMAQMLKEELKEVKG